MLRLRSLSGNLAKWRRNAVAPVAVARRVNRSPRQGWVGSLASELAKSVWSFLELVANRGPPRGKMIIAMAERVNRFWDTDRHGKSQSIFFMGSTRPWALEVWASIVRNC